jgi:hypothetical protein
LNDASPLLYAEQYWGGISKYQPLNAALVSGRPGNAMKFAAA